MSHKVMKPWRNPVTATGRPEVEGVEDIDSGSTPGIMDEGEIQPSTLPWKFRKEGPSWPRCYAKD